MQLTDAGKAGFFVAPVVSDDLTKEFSGS